MLIIDSEIRHELRSMRIIQKFRAIYHIYNRIYYFTIIVFSSISILHCILKARVAANKLKQLQTSVV